MPMTEATIANLRRKSKFVDQVQTYNGVPLFSLIDLSLTELCNRKCPFCPRVDPNVYPNQALHMPMTLVAKMARDLRRIDYDGTVVLCGFGEPMLHPNVVEIVSTFAAAPKTRVEIVTNGDQLTVGGIRRLYEAGLDYMVVSMYDGPDQIKWFNDMFFAAGIDKDRFMLRDRWHTAEDAFGLKLTNRAGTVSVGEQDPVDRTHPCYYLAYELAIDWNGDVLLCVQDWNKRVKLGNAQAQGLLEIWTSPAMAKHRARLIAGRRDQAPCSSCNTEGTLHGRNHVQAWNEAREKR